jgi:hypothetical protein
LIEMRLRRAAVVARVAPRRLIETFEAMAARSHLRATGSAPHD